MSPDDDDDFDDASGDDNVGSDEDDSLGDAVGDDIDDSSGDSTSEPEGGAACTVRGVIAKLRQDLLVAPFDSELHAALIGMLREAADLDRLREARSRAAFRVALPESLWLEWLQDEKRLAGDADFEELCALHEAACCACPVSSRIWLLRCALHREAPSPPPTVRAIYEEALDTLGLHATEGPEVWADYRDYEESLLAAAADGTQERASQAQRVRALFFRQLALPLPGIDRLREALGTFEDSLGSVREQTSKMKAETIATLATASWQQREALEQRLLDASRPRVCIEAAGSVDNSGSDVSAELLALEESSGDPSRIWVGHLRATCWAPRDECRWLRFANFVTSTLQDRKKAAVVLERAVRNCPHSGALWLELHVEREASGATLVELGKVMESGVEALRDASAHGAGDAAETALQEFLLYHADACRRAAASVPAGSQRLDCWTQMRAALERAVNLSPGGGAEGGLCCQALLHLMRLEAYAVHDSKATLDAGKRLMRFWGGYYNVWSAFIAASRHCLGSDAYSTVRELYKSAIAQVADYPSQVCSDYVQFERECGTLESWREAQQMARQCEALAAADASVHFNPSGCEATGQACSVEVTGEELPPAAKKRDNAGGKSAQPKKKLRRLKKGELNGDPVITSGTETGVANVSEHATNSNVHVRVGTTDGAVGGAGEGNTICASSARVVRDETQKSNSVACEWEQSCVEQEPPCDVTDRAKGTLAADALAVPRIGVPGSGMSEAGCDGCEKNGVVEALPLAFVTGSKDHAGGESVAEAHVSTVDGPEVDKGPEGDIQMTVGPSSTASEPTREDEKGEAVEAPSLPVEDARDERDAGAGEAPARTAAGAAAPQGGAEDAAAPHPGSHYHQRRLGPGAAATLRPEAEGERTVFVSGLDWSVDEAQLQKIFSDVPGLREVRLVRDFLQRSKGYAYVDFEQTEQVAAAVEKFNGQVVNNRAMSVARSLPTKPLFESRTIFIKHMCAGTTEADIRGAFSEKGEIVGVRIPMDDTGLHHKGYAFVEFAVAESVEAALALDGMRLGGQAIQVARSIPMKDHRHQTAAPRKDLPQRWNQKQILADQSERSDPVKQAAMCPTTIYVKNLAFKVDESELRNHFSQCGEVSQVLLARNERGRSRGFGFVEFAREDHAQAALTLTGSLICGREVWVSRSQRVITQKKSRQGAESKEGNEASQQAKACEPAATGMAKSKPMSDASKRDQMQDAAPRQRPFRSHVDSQREHPSTVSDDPTKAAAKNISCEGEDANSGAEADMPAQPLSNADFRAMLLRS